MNQEIPGVHRKAVAELVRSLVKELLHVLDEVMVITGEASTVFEGRADLLNGKGCLVVRTGEREKKFEAYASVQATTQAQKRP